MSEASSPVASAVVTGAASGIGHAIAERLAAERVAVVAVDIDHERLSHLAEAGGGMLLPLSGDVTSTPTLRKAVELAEATAPLRAWVNNAAVLPSPPRPLHETPPEDIQRLLEVDLIAGVEGVRVAVEHFMAAQIAGSIVNITSVHAGRAFAGWTGYSVAKAGLEALTRVAAVEYGRYGIRVNAVAPALVAVDRWHEEQAQLSRSEADTRHDRIKRQYPLDRIAEPAEVAEAVAFLLSGRASYITGSTVMVDGGFTLQAADDWRLREDQ